MCAWRDSERHDSRLLADVERLLEENDATELDYNIGVRALL